MSECLNVCVRVCVCVCVCVCACVCLQMQDVHYQQSDQMETRRQGHSQIAAWRNECVHYAPAKATSKYTHIPVVGVITSTEGQDVFQVHRDHVTGGEAMELLTTHSRV